MAWASRPRGVCWRRGHPGRRGLTIRLALAGAGVHFVVLLVVFGFVIATSMAHFDYPERRSPLLWLANAALMLLGLPLVTRLLILRLDLPQLVQLLTIFCNSVLWGILFWLLARWWRAHRVARGSTSAPDGSSSS